MMQTLFIPDKIHIRFINESGNPLKQEKILIGIQTFANYRNSIDISPFLTNADGTITITSEEIAARADNYIGYGLMDYVELKYAKPEIEIYYWGNKNIDRYITYWSEVLQRKHLNGWNEKLIANLHKQRPDFQKEIDEQLRKEEADLNVYTTCFNRTVNQQNNITLIKDNWSKPEKELSYEVSLSLER